MAKISAAYDVTEEEFRASRHDVPDDAVGFVLAFNDFGFWCRMQDEASRDHASSVAQARARRIASFSLYVAARLYEDAAECLAIDDHGCTDNELHERSMAFLEHSVSMEPAYVPALERLVTSYRTTRTRQKLADLIQNGIRGCRSESARARLTRLQGELG